MDLRGRNRDLLNERPQGLPVVAVRMVRRNVALVSEEQKRAVPGKIAVLLGEQGIETFWRRPAGKRDGKSPLRPDCIAAGANEFIGGGMEQIGRRGQHFDGSNRRHREFVMGDL